LIYQDPDQIKNSAYECGFQPFEYIIQEFDIKYYVIALLFLIFDLEIVFLLPLIVALNSNSLMGFVVIFFFVCLLILGFIYE
jgi:NADH-quinone oxidoreductase subunit A